MKKSFKLLSSLMVSLLAVGAGVALGSVSKDEVETKATDYKRMYIEFNGHSDQSGIHLYESGDTWPGKTLSSCHGFGSVTAKYENYSKTFYTFDVDTSSSYTSLTQGNGDNEWNITSALTESWNLVQLTNWGKPASYNAHHMHKIKLVDGGNTTYEYNPAEWGKYHLPTHTGSGSFAGWYLDGDTSTTRIDDGGEYSLSSSNCDDVMFEAVYNVPEFTVTFKSEDGTQTLDTDTVKQGSAASTSVVPKKSSVGLKNFVFDYWATTAGGSTEADLTNIQSDMSVYAHFALSYSDGRCLVGFNDSFTTDTAIHMHWDSKNSQDYYEQLSLTRGNKIKTAWCSSSGVLSDYKGYSNINDSGEKFCFRNDGDDNIVVFATGVYNFYQKNGVIYVVKDGANYNAQQLAAKLMSYDVSGTAPDCKDSSKFPACKNIFLALSSEQQAIFKSFETSGTQDFKNAYDRYVAWAAANAQKPWEEGASSNFFNIFEVTNDSTKAITVVVIVSLASLTAVGGFFFYRKRRHN